MSESASLLRRSRRVTWRSGILVGIMAVVGLLAGVATAAIIPGMVTSTALLVLPPPTQSAAAAAAAVGGELVGGELNDGFTATQEVIAGSNVVLAYALPELGPAASLTGLQHNIRIDSPSPDIISINATGTSAGDAEAAANAVADSYVKYVRTTDNSALRVQATVLQWATSATRTAWLMRLLTGAMLGAVSGLLAGVGAVVARRRLL